MTDEETRRQWFATREQAHQNLEALADLKVERRPHRRLHQLPEPEPPPPPPRGLDTQPTPAPAPVDWSAVDERIEAAIQAYTTPMLEGIGAELADSFRDASFEAKMEVADECRKLRLELAELQVVVAELRVALAYERGKSLDLPALPRREMN